VLGIHREKEPVERTAMSLVAAESPIRMMAASPNSLRICARTASSPDAVFFSAMGILLVSG
jgi:hypothetical protein